MIKSKITKDGVTIEVECDNAGELMSVISRAFDSDTKPRYTPKLSTDGKMMKRGHYKPRNGGVVSYDVSHLPNRFKKSGIVDAKRLHFPWSKKDILLVAQTVEDHLTKGSSNGCYQEVVEVLKREGNKKNRTRGSIDGMSGSVLAYFNGRNGKYGPPKRISSFLHNQGILPFNERGDTLVHLHTNFLGPVEA